MITSRSARQLSAVEKKDKAQPKVPVAKRFMEGDPSLEPEPRQRRRPESKGRPRAPKGEADTVVTQALQPKKKAGGRALRPRKTASRAGARGADGDEAPRGRSRKGPIVSADFWTSDHLSERSRSVDAFSGTRARGTLTLKRR